MVRKIKTLSLFSGAGGLDIGFHRAGFEIVACVELEAAYCQTLQANVGRGREFGSKTQVFNADVREFDAHQFRDQGIECVIGGPPCQTFSAAGRRAGGVIGTGDERGQLFRSYCSILDVLKPKVFVFENVYGLPGANGGGPWREIVESFSALGYELTAEVVDAADYGVPQHRERLIMVGHRDRFTFPAPTHGPDSRSGADLVGVEAAVSDLQDAAERPSGGLGGLYGHLLPEVPEGLNYAFFTAEMGHPQPVFAWRSKFHDLLYKVDRRFPCRTIKAKPGKFTGPFHWNNRHFRADELKRLQSFPDEYRIEGSPQRVLEQVGNSVPPRLAQVFATSVREQLFTKPTRLTYATRGAGFKSTFRQRQRERSKEFRAIASRAIKKRYGRMVAGLMPRVGRSFDASYYALDSGLFDRRVFQTRPRKSSVAGARLFSVRVKDCGAQVDISCRRLGVARAKCSTAEIVMTGLAKYLGRVDELRLRGEVCAGEDVVSLWRVVESTLVDGSQFFSLIDVYGHYANRGDVVEVSSSFDLPRSTPLGLGLALFGQTRWCGGLVPRKEVQSRIRSEGAEISVDEVVRVLREVRFDFRTQETHPILKSGQVLCTYPFPLLSKKAMVDSKAVVMRAPDPRAARQQVQEELFRGAAD